ncbi:molybdenum cofactor biosynthesis protein MoaE [Methyloceanibacter sp.]|uniref:molybdenum cofactor biosynthesis protein MoaE n=1 Tax=Methyloceanibacter sp. TaxID=1965321 RepID=UPI002D3B742C|nr:molybdenum cofactor biosynthesis protein MoaE [Methyloceanibacter sp.]HZP08213.1 molybdenum cofactor biosynthesis protein MoaE [Methyloceanibacter sp.]
MIRVQQEDFDVGVEIAALKGSRTDIGAIVSFIGAVRDQMGAIEELTLEHYPGMTEAELAKIEQEAKARWPLQASLIVHRYGRLLPGDNIVLVLTASEHRDAAFEAARFLMDYLKTSAPFWKKESGKGGSRWVEAAARDDAARARWSRPKPAAE